MSCIGMTKKHYRCSSCSYQYSLTKQNENQLVTKIMERVWGGKDCYCDIFPPKTIIYFSAWKLPLLWEVKASTGLKLSVSWSISTIAQRIEASEFKPISHKLTLITLSLTPSFLRSKQMAAEQRSWVSVDDRCML